MKKLLALMMILTLALSLAACGSKPAPAPAPASTPAPASSAAPAETPASVPAEEEPVTYTLDYDTIASWVDSGFIGQDDAGSPVLMGIDAANETAIIIFGDNSDMTAASFVGAVTYEDTTATIIDEASNSSLTFGVTQIADDTIELDMGDIGKATIKAATKDDLLAAIQLACENYTHVA